jgi:hypothetical protein
VRPEFKAGVWQTARAGDGIASFAVESGLFCQTIWNHALNAELKRGRNDPNVLAMRDAYWQGRRRLVPAGDRPPSPTTMKNTGLIGLAPGRYVVLATLRDTWTMTDHGVEQMMAYAPTYYPGTAGVSDAACHGRRETEPVKGDSR